MPWRSQFAVPGGTTPGQPRFQAVFCIDEREESIRRHLEELAPDAATFGTAGFFSVAMYYRGVADAHFVPLCPAVIRPRHWVAEQVDRRPTGRPSSSGQRPGARWGWRRTSSTSAAGR